MSTGPFGSGAFGTASYGNQPLFNTKSLIDAVLRDTGHGTPATETNKRLAVLGFLQNRYAFVATRRHWDWLYQTQDILFKAPYDDGTISIDNRSQTVTGTDTLWSANAVPNNMLVISGRSDRYLIDAVTSATILALQGQFAGDDVTDSGYQILKPIYTAPSDLETLQSIVLGDNGGKLVPLGLQEFRRKQAGDLTQTGTPKWFTELGRRAEDGVRTYEIYPAPDRDYSAQLNYGVNIMALEDAEDSYPLIPDRHRTVLYYGAMAEMFMFLRDADSALIFEKKFVSILDSMYGDTKLTDSKLVLSARRGRTGKSRRRYGIAMDMSDFARED